MYDPAQALGTCIASHFSHICEVEAAVEVENDMLHREGLSAVGHRSAVGKILRTHILKPLTAIELQ